MYPLSPAAGGKATATRWEVLRYAGSTPRQAESYGFDRFSVRHATGTTTESGFRALTIAGQRECGYLEDEGLLTRQLPWGKQAKSYVGACHGHY